jgi:hypothetical protein
MHYDFDVVTLTIKLTPELKQRLEHEAKQSGRTISAVIRDVVDRHLTSSGDGPSLFDRTRDLCGTGGSGTPDLATSAEHLRGLGQ